MVPAADTATGDAGYWAGALFACLQDMAALSSNAALLTLDGVERLERGRRYPDAGLEFAGKRWRAFYHCHDSGPTAAREHGHFHIFTTAGKQGWAHVAGLSIDAMGQPLQWFAVNRWVTDGPWLAAGDLQQQLAAATGCAAEPLVGRWLLALLQLDQAGLAELLARRDTELQRHAAGRDIAEVHADRTLYTLATRRVDLQLLLQHALAFPPAAAAQRRHA
jgi:hypothetical protein